MKVKLLRKIRKRYSIVYYPKGVEVMNLGIYDTDIYYVFMNKCTIWGSFESSKNDCIDWIMKEVRKEYGKEHHSKGIKVWYNG